MDTFHPSIHPSKWLRAHLQWQYLYPTISPNKSSAPKLSESVIPSLSVETYLVVSTHLKSIRQIGSFPQVEVKIKSLKPPPRKTSPLQSIHQQALGNWFNWIWLSCTMKTTHFVWYEHTKKHQHRTHLQISALSFLEFQKIWKKKIGVMFAGKKTAMGGISHRSAQNVDFPR